MKPFLTLAITVSFWFAQVKTTQRDYFPPEVLGETEQSSHFKEQWYSDQLRALKEPSLWEQSKTQKSQTYRFLWLRSFHNPISVRLDVREDGSGLLTTKVTSGQGGYKPGKLVTNKTGVLTREQTAWAVEQIKETGFWGLQSHENTKEGVGPNGEKTVEVRADGAQWIFEGVNNGKYQVADRWSPQNGPVRDLGIIMLVDLAKLKLLSQEVY